MTTSEAYAKLRPPEPTPADEICRCGSEPAIKLMTALSYNPIHCVAYNLEVPPERLGLPPQLAEAVAYWNWIADGIHRLWLASGAYEDWARSQLADLASPVNVEGRRTAGELNGLRGATTGASWIPTRRRLGSLTARRVIDFWPRCLPGLLSTPSAKSAA
jgi:hypothetical protein